MLDKALSWLEIELKYPDKWVALDNVKFRNNDRINVLYADVVCAMSYDEYPSTRVKHIREGKNYFYTMTTVKGIFVSVMTHEGDNNVD